MDAYVVTAQLVSTLATIPQMKSKPGKRLCKQICPPSLWSLQMKKKKIKASEDAGKSLTCASQEAQSRLSLE